MDSFSTVKREVMGSLDYFKLKKMVQGKVDESGVILAADMKEYMIKIIEKSGYETKFENIAYEIKKRKELGTDRSGDGENEPLDYLRKAQATWEKCIVKSINSMCTELAVPLSRRRSVRDQNDFSTKFNTLCLGANYSDEAHKKLRPVYSSADFFEVLIGVKNNNLQTSRKDEQNCHWGLIHASLHTPLLQEIRERFKHMSGNNFQCGIDDFQDNRRDQNVTDWYRLGHKVVSERHTAAAQQYAKQGCPAGLRKQLWLTMFNLSITNEERLYMEQLKSYVFEYDMLVDHLIMKDVRLTTTNDDSFFVFEDLLYQILLVFSRDTQLLEHYKYSAAAPPKSYIRGKLGIQECCVHYPPSGIIPFHGFSMFAAPLCFMFADATELYFVFRRMYTNYFFRLHYISSHPEGILSLCSLFETLLQLEEPLLFKHMLDVGAQPLRMVFNWLLFAFSGYLSTDQTLQLWDRILGYNSLQLLPVTAVAILSYRKDNLMTVDSATACEAVLADISTINVIPVLVSFIAGRRV